MSNIIRLDSPSRILPLDQRLAALIRTFASERRQGDDVYWLKENAELLILLRTSGFVVSEEALSPLRGFLKQVPKRIAFFPQYYRFLLSIALDLEALGMAGDIAQELVEWTFAEGLADAETSDLQRLEAKQLMMRRGVNPFPNDAGLEDRMRAFIAQPRLFAVPNKKAAYELTHIVFYLSEYGQKDPLLCDKALKSLYFAGLLAFIDENADLLSEICISLGFAGQTAPKEWTDWLNRVKNSFRLCAFGGSRFADDYHMYLMCQWQGSLCGDEPFRSSFPDGGVAFEPTHRGQSVLHLLSDCMFRLGDRRSGDWDAMRHVVSGTLSEAAQSVVETAARSSALFPAFFADFARTRRLPERCHA